MKWYLIFIVASCEHIHINTAKKMHSAGWDFEQEEEELLPHPGLWSAASIRCPAPQQQAWLVTVPAVPTFSLAAERRFLPRTQDWLRGKSFRWFKCISFAHWLQQAKSTVQEKKCVNVREKKNFLSHFSYESPLLWHFPDLLGFLCVTIGTNPKIAMEKCDNFNCRF